MGGIRVAMVAAGAGLVQGVGGKPGASIIEIEGAPTDHNTTLLYQGQQSVLKPKYDSGAYKLAGSQRIPEWNNQQGGVAFEQFLTANGGKVDGVLAANDGMAGAVLTAALARGDRTAADALATGTATDPTANRTVKSVLLTPILITKDNVKQVVDAGGVTASEICVADTAAVCGQLGIR